MFKKTYSYIWSVLIRAKEDGKGVEEIKFKASKKISPYSELNVGYLDFEDMKRVNQKYEIDVNPYIRFAGPFTELLNINYKKSIKLRESLANVFFHIMANLDMMEGQSKREYHIEFIILDLQNKKFGQEIKTLFNLFNENEQRNIAEVMHDLYTFENRVEAYKKALKKIFNASILYNNNFSKNEVVVYLSNKDTKENRQKLRCLDMLFLPLGLKTRVFWEYHFGILGIPATTKIGKIAIY